MRLKMEKNGFLYKLTKRADRIMDKLLINSNLCSSYILNHLRSANYVQLQFIHDRR